MKLLLSLSTLCPVLAAADLPTLHPKAAVIQMKSGRIALVGQEIIPQWRHASAMNRAASKKQIFVNNSAEWLPWCSSRAATASVALTAGQFPF